VKDAATLIGSLALALWPVLALVVAWRLLPVLCERLRHSDVDVSLPGTQIKISNPVLGRDISLEDHAVSLRRSIIDLQNRVELLDARLDTASPPAKLTQGFRRHARQVGAILWVDDAPDRKAVELTQLAGRGFQIDYARSTEEALVTVVNGSYVAVVTNMQRRENGTYRPKAGLELIHALRDAGIVVPVLGYCSVGSVAKFSEEAVQAGAVAVTASPIELLSQIDSACPAASHG
jgi:ActR/RegA family two-component response regulator